MKSVNEIRDMIDTASDDCSREAVRHRLDIMFAMLEQIDTLNSRTDIKPTAPAPTCTWRPMTETLTCTFLEGHKGNHSWQCDLPNCEWKDAKHSTKFHLGARAGEVDYAKPHPFDLAGDSGLKHTEYRVCKCGMSEGNALHQ